jgi:hypothetical protein
MNIQHKQLETREMETGLTSMIWNNGNRTTILSTYYRAVRQRGVEAIQRLSCESLSQHRRRWAEGGQVTRFVAPHSAGLPRDRTAQYYHSYYDNKIILIHRLQLS